MATLRCPDCGHKVKADMELCPECGRHIAGHTVLCPGCGQLVSVRRKVCPHCHAHTDGSTPETTPPTGNPTKTEEKIGGSFLRSFLITMTFLLGMAFIAGGLLWWRRHQEQERERMAYVMLDGCMQREMYQDFIERYPDSPMLDDVVHRMKEVDSLAGAWDIVCRKDRREGYATFADNHMNSPYYKLCLARMDSIDWATAHRRATPQAYARYLEDHPDGIYADDAREQKQLREELLVTDAERAMLQGLLNTYFSALTRRDEEALRRVTAFLSVRYWGRNNASQDYAVERMKRMYDGSDVSRISFALHDDWQIEKQIVRPYRYTYKVAFKADAIYSRTKPGGERHAVFDVAARVSLDHKIDSIELHKQSAAPSATK
ncbi:MAG: zinc ribbon domain-containing protein [Clostridium sp.]|nr:zinc ribbon domain-containing protein [Clostridium sp.]